MKEPTVLVLPSWYPTRRQPFLGPFVRDHVRAAAAQGNRMAVLVDEGVRPQLGRPFSLEEERDGAARVFRFAYRLRTGLFGHVLAALAVARRLARDGTPVDVLHAHVHRMGWAAVTIGARIRRPVVISEHSSAWPSRTIGAGERLRATIAFRRAALVCPVDESLQRAIEGYGLHARFRVVPNTVDTRLFHPRATAPEDSPARLVNVALHVEVKRLDVLLRAFAEIAARREDVSLDLVGEGPLTPELKALAAQLGLDERVRFRGAATPPEVAEAMRSSDVLVLSSRTENLPLAVLEALCCGLPVAATDVGGVAGAVGDDGVLASRGSPEGLAAAIEAVLERHNRFDRADIARRAAERWSFEAVGGTWSEIYRSLSAGRP